MEALSSKDLVAIGEQLAAEGHIPPSFVQLLSTELQSPGRLEQLRLLLADRSVKQFLKLHLLNEYNSQFEDTVQENHAPTLTYERLKKVSEQARKGPTEAPSKENILAQLISSSADALETKFSTCSRFLAMMLSSRKENLIQNYFGRLIELLLGTAHYAYARWNSEDAASKIEYYNASLSHLTVFLKDEPHHHTIKELFTKLGVGVSLFDSSDPRFRQTFNISQPGSYLCQVLEQDGQSLIFIFRSSDEELYKQLIRDQPLADLYGLLLSGASETLHASKFEVLNTEYALKSILDLLEFCMRVDARMLQLTIEQHYRQASKEFNMGEWMKKLAESSSAEDRAIAAAYESYCSQVFRYQSTTGKYKAQVLDSGSIYLNFNNCGELGFVSHKLPSSLVKRLLQKAAETEQITVFDLFFDRPELLSKLQSAAEGRQVDEACKFSHDGRFVEAVFETDDRLALVSFFCKVSSKKRKQLGHRVEGSLKNLSSNSIHSTDSEKEITTKIREGTGINHLAQRMLVEQEQARPGVSKTGWLQAFMKNDVLDKYRRSALSSKKDFTSPTTEATANRKRMSVTLTYEPSSELGKTLQQIDSYELNLLEVDKDILIPLAKSLLLKMKFLAGVQLDQELLDNFLRELATKYGKYSNPFHNFIHGVNVMHMCYLLSRLNRNRQYLSDITAFALVFSGLCHDVGHPGRTNAFEINSQSKKAIRYNDRSPLENYHASTSYKILLKPENNFLSVLKKEQFAQIRKEFVANILATDIKEHFPLVNNFEAKLKSPKGFENIPADIELTTTFLIHTSDFAGACKPFEVSRKWAELVNQEFSSQYSQEGELGIAQTPYMKNLEKEEVMAQNEAGFLKVIVRPLFKLLSDVNEKEEEVRQLLKNIDENMLVWEKIVADYKARSEVKN